MGLNKNYLVDKSNVDLGQCINYTLIFFQIIFVEYLNNIIL